MNKTTKSLFAAGGLTAVTLLAAAWQLYDRRPRERVAGFEELDDPQVARGFDRVARMPQMRLLRWFVARRAGRMVQEGLAVDLGCGPGYLVMELVRQAPRLQVTGIDLSEEMLATAERYAWQAGLAGRVSFKLGDVQQIPLPDASIDLVVSTLSLHHWTDPVAVLNEVNRVLRPGGAYLLFDLRRDLAAPAWLLLWFATRFVVPKPLRWANEPLGSRDAAYTPEEAAGLVQASNLPNWHITAGPLWLAIEGTQRGGETGTRGPTTHLPLSTPP